LSTGTHSIVAAYGGDAGNAASNSAALSQVIITTAPLDYLILSLSIVLNPFTAHAIDLAGALISPLLALLGGWFLCWWSRRFRFRWALLILYAISPILVHGSELGRPDHQSLSILLVTIALCAEWTLRTESTKGWSIVSGIAWGFAIWVSAYEPLLLLLLLLAVSLLQDRHLVFSTDRRAGWIMFGAVLLLAAAIERRIPSMSILYSSDVFKNWAGTIGELAHVSPTNPIWFRWAGWLLIAAPFLIWFGWSTRLRSPRRPTAWQASERNSESTPMFIVALLIATYLLTIWQARWAYFFMSIFAIALPALLEPIKSRAIVWAAFILSIFPILRDWDARLWPNDAELARRLEHRHEAIELRESATTMMSSETHPFLAPWWLSPSIAYWSGQPGVGGSSHESLPGIADSARFFLATDSQQAREIIENRKVSWVVAYDADRVIQNSAAILGAPVPGRPFAQILDRTPAQAPGFLVLTSQNGVDKLFWVGNKR
jgi:hypothetical protein